MTTNKTLNDALSKKYDEYYTQYDDVEAELEHYEEHFKNKVVYCNCDDPSVSSFYKYFKSQFKHLKLKKVIASCYKSKNADAFSKHDSQKAVYREFTGNNSSGRPKQLKGNGDFRDEECIELLKQADIIVTNPPFSLFRPYVEQLIEHKKKFLILGSTNAITYREIFRLIKNNKIWLGNKSVGSDMLFDVSTGYAKHLKKNKKEGSAYRIVDGIVKARTPAIWFTNLSIKKRYKDIQLFRSYRKRNKGDFPTYDNCKAIEVDRVSQIPIDYKGVMGVPVTFIDKYNPRQFEIVGNETDLKIKRGRVYIDGQRMYSRIFIRNKRLRK